MGRRTATRTGEKKLNIVNVLLTPAEKSELDQACDARGMTIKALVGRLVEWFGECDKTEQAIVLGQVEAEDLRAAAFMVQWRGER